MAGRVRGHVSILRTHCFASSRVFVRRMKLCGLTASGILRAPTVSRTIEMRNTHVMSIGPACAMMDGGKLASRVLSLCSTLGRCNYILRCMHSNHVTVAGDYARCLSRFLTRHHGICSRRRRQGTGGGWSVASDGINSCSFITRPFRISFANHVFVNILKGRFLGYTNFRSSRHGFNVTRLRRGGCA